VRTNDEHPVDRALRMRCSVRYLPHYQTRCGNLASPTLHPPPPGTSRAL
jgi:hypothetical protein